MRRFDATQKIKPRNDKRLAYQYDPHCMTLTLPGRLCSDQRSAGRVQVAWKGRGRSSLAE